MRVLLTRGAEDNARLARTLAGTGVECLDWPLLTIERLGLNEPAPDGAEAVVLTSAAAAYALPCLSANDLIPVICVGDRTAAAARAVHDGPVRSAGGNVQDLEQLITSLNFRHVVYLRGQEVATDLAADLEPKGIRVDQRIVYAARAGGPPESHVEEALQTGALDVVTVWSPRAAAIFKQFLDAAPCWQIDRMTLIGISKKAVEPLSTAKFRAIGTARLPNADEMVKSVSAAMRQ